MIRNPFRVPNDSHSYLSRFISPDNAEGDHGLRAINLCASPLKRNWCTVASTFLELLFRANTDGNTAHFTA